MATCFLIFAISSWRTPTTPALATLAHQPPMAPMPLQLFARRVFWRDCYLAAPPLLVFFLALVLAAAALSPATPLPFLQPSAPT